MYQNFRKTSFTIIKHTVYDDRDYAVRVASRLEKIKTDFKTNTFFDRIKIPRFEFELKENTLIIQSEYIKGRPPVEKEFPYIYDNVVYRPHPWTFLDVNTSNFVVDDFHYKDKTSSPIYVIDLDNYQECSMEKRELNCNLVGWKRGYAKGKFYNTDI